MKHLEDQNILTDRQFGFRFKCFCESQLYITHHQRHCQANRFKLTSWCCNAKFFKGLQQSASLESSLQTELLWNKVDVLHWLESFLNGRTPQVIVEGCLWCDVWCTPRVCPWTSSFLSLYWRYHFQHIELNKFVCRWRIYLQNYLNARWPSNASKWLKFACKMVDLLKDGLQQF